MAFGLCGFESRPRHPHEKRLVGIVARPWPRLLSYAPSRDVAIVYTGHSSRAAGDLSLAGFGAGR